MAWRGGQHSDPKIVDLRVRRRAREARPKRVRRWLDWTKWGPIILVIAAAVVGAGILIQDLTRSAEKFGSWNYAVRHLLASNNCDAADGVRLGKARRGQPGYYPSHDADNDGIACEWKQRDLDITFWGLEPPSTGGR
jgi:hypothetical protein